eukprot:4632644-Prymnesium_polylepis.2
MSRELRLPCLRVSSCEMQRAVRIHLGSHDLTGRVRARVRVVGYNIQVHSQRRGRMQYSITH